MPVLDVAHGPRRPPAAGQTRRRRRAAAVCLAALAAVPVFALDPQKAFHQYRLDVWETEDGLPQASVIAVVQTTDGYLWLGGYEGLDRFDGVRFTTFDRSNTPELGDNNIFDLAESADGSLWIGTDGGGLTRLLDGRFTGFTTADGLVDDRVYCLHPAREGGVWIGTKGGLSRFQSGRFSSWGAADGLPADHVTALAEDPSGGLWIGTPAGLARLEDGAVSTYTTRDGLAGDDVASLLVDRAGQLWIGAYGAGLTRYRAGAFEPVAAGGPSTADANSLLEDSDGNLWISTYGRGLLRLTHGRGTTYGAADGLSSDLIWDLAEDREGSVWLATEGGGLLRLKDPPLVPVTARDGLPHERILSVYQDAGGILWLGTGGGGLVKREAGVFSVYDVADGLPSAVVTATCRRRDGSLWIGTSRGVRQLQDGRITADLAAEIGAVEVKALLEDRRQRLWIGTDGDGLLRIEGGAVAAVLTEADGLPAAGVRALAEDRGGRLWIGLDGGLASLEGETVNPVPELAGAFVRALHEDADGSLWVGTRGSGLARVRGAEVRIFTSGDGLFTDVVYQILEDGRRNLWMSCAKGIFRVARDELEAFARGEVRSVRSVAYGTADGMKTLECNGGSQPAGWKTANGELLFPTNKGLVVVDPDDLQPAGPPPPVYVERVTADGAVVGNENLDPGVAVDLPPGRGELQLDYTALSFSDPAKVRFRYRLEGYDDAWIHAGERRSAFYTNLPPGRYVFKVTASHADAVWQEAADEISVRLRPALHQTWTFYLGCVAIIAAAAAGLYRLRVRGLMRRHEELRRLHAELEAKNAAVEAKNAELQRFTYAVSHDLKSPLLTILGFLGFLERDLAAGDRERVAADADRIRNAATRMRHLLDELLELSRIGRMDNPPEPADLGRLAFEALELVSGQIAERGVEVHISPALPVVVGDRPRLLQLLQNLIDNAVKFMGEQAEPQIEIGTAVDADGGSGLVTCYVKDNGAGIDPEYHDRVFGLFNQLEAGAEGAGMGLAMVQRIVEVHGGRIWVESEGEGKGSTFFFTLPTEDSVTG